MDSGGKEKITVSIGEFNHEMTREHYIFFMAYAAFDRVLTVRLYPEQDSSARFPKMHGGKFYYYCNKHGLFEYTTGGKRCADRK